MVVLVLAAFVVSVILTQPGSAGPLDNRQWRNTSPQENNLVGSAHGKGAYVAAGDNGAVLQFGRLLINNADFDGDNQTDIAVWRPADGNWYVLSSSDAAGAQVTQSDIPVPGDYDGDCKTDIAVWRPNNGKWYFIPSSGGGITVNPWGAGTPSCESEVPIPGNDDGDGNTDIAVWRPEDGNWYIIRATDGGIIMRKWGSGWANDCP